MPQEPETPSYLFDLAKCQDFSKMNEGVKALSEKCESENKKVDTKEEINSSENANDLSDELEKILSFDKDLSDIQKGNVQKHDSPPPGILTF